MRPTLQELQHNDSGISYVSVDLSLPFLIVLVSLALCFLTNRCTAVSCCVSCSNSLEDLLVVKHPPPVRLHLAKGGLGASCLLQRVSFQRGR